MEALLEEHFATHTPVDYLLTIRRLNGRVEALEKVGFDE